MVAETSFVRVPPISGSFPRAPRLLFTMIVPWISAVRDPPHVGAVPLLLRPWRMLFTPQQMLFGRSSGSSVRKYALPGPRLEA